MAVQTFKSKKLLLLVNVSGIVQTADRIAVFITSTQQFQWKSCLLYCHISPFCSSRACTVNFCADFQHCEHQNLLTCKTAKTILRLLEKNIRKMGLEAIFVQQFNSALFIRHSNKTLWSNPGVYNSFLGYVVSFSYIASGNSLCLGIKTFPMFSISERNVPRFLSLREVQNFPNLSLEGTEGGGGCTQCDDEIKAKQNNLKFSPELPSLLKCSLAQSEQDSDSLTKRT